MKIVDRRVKTSELFSLAKNEAKKYFGNDEYILKNILKIQDILRYKLCQEKIELCSLGERDCSVQRRHQKLIEETPSPVLTKSKEKIY